MFKKDQLIQKYSNAPNVKILLIIFVISNGLKKNNNVFVRTAILILIFL